MKTFGVYYAHNKDGKRNGDVIIIQRPHKGQPAKVLTQLNYAERFALIGELFNPVDAKDQRTE